MSGPWGNVSTTSMSYVDPPKHKRKAQRVLRSTHLDEILPSARASININRCSKYYERT